MGRILKIVGLVLIVVIIIFIVRAFLPEPPAVDEAKAAGLTVADLPEAPENYFAQMDGGIELTEDEVKGRNTWMIYTGGNEAFWDFIANRSFGTVDLLKILSSHPTLRANRDNRFNYLGLMNEPGFKKAEEPGEFGLWLDEPDGTSDPFNRDVYGEPSGILGLRLFPNPEFDKEAEENWDAERYFTDRAYYYDKDLVRPYRVGMACAFCHVGPDPVNPPADPEKPQWANLSSYIGNQYFWVGRVFSYELEKDNFVWQLFNSSPPGALETSMVATDNINNPRTMNSIYNVGARLSMAEEEELAGGNLDLNGVEDTMKVPHILKDGADAVGIIGALTRVYFNIGSFHQEWVRHFNPILGGKKQTPIEVKVARENSVYFQSTEQRVGNLAKFFLKAAVPHKLADAPNGDKFISKNKSTMDRGKRVFAENCAGCHSSKQPPPEVEPGSTEYLTWMKKEVMKPDFLENNYLSNDKRYPITEIKTNAGAAMASNATRGHVWDNFSSETYKNLPPVGSIEVEHPLDGSKYTWEAPGGGRGYLRVPTLVSIWAGAPFFLNNALGKFTNDPSVVGRMEAFEDAAEKLLWPERRQYDDCMEIWGMPFCPPVYRTTEKSWIVINKTFIPPLLRPILGWKRYIGMGDDAYRIGPIPKGTPINLLANLDFEIRKSNVPKLIKLIFKIKKTLKRIHDEEMNEEESTALLSTLVPDLLDASKCPDFVVDRGHYFGTEIPDADKVALIEFMKTF